MAVDLLPGVSQSPLDSHLLALRADMVSQLVRMPDFRKFGPGWQVWIEL